MEAIQDPFMGLAFPLIRVRYCGPTDTRGSRYAARVLDTESTYAGAVLVSYDDGVSASHNAHRAAHASWEKHCAALPTQTDPSEAVLIPTNLDRTSYGFAAVPRGFLKDLS